MKKSEQKLLQKRILRALFLIISLFSLMAGMLIILDGLVKEKKKESLLTYETNGNVEYNFDIKENDFYGNEKNNNVISRYIDGINLKFNYNLSSSAVITSKAEYEINMELVNVMSNDTKKVLWKEKYELFPKKIEERKNTSVALFNEELQIDYKYYRNLAEKFRNESGVLTEAFLNIEFKIKNNISNQDINQNNIEDNHVILIKIPLLENITTIEENGFFQNNETIYEDKNQNINLIEVIIGGILLLVSIIFMYTAGKVFFETEKISEYIIRKEKILKKYADIIAETSTKPMLNGISIIEITNFIDLVNIEDELRIPILFYEVTKNKESWFVIIQDKKSYRYTLKTNEKTRKRKK